VDQEGDNVMRASVIVPLYNKERFVARALRSIVNQTVNDIEIIVVDDGSTDTSLARASAVNDPRILLISQPNGGPGAARNRGAAEARGEVLAFLDADDEWLPHFLEHALGTLGRAGTTAAVVGYQRFPGGHSTEHLWRRRGLADGVMRVTPETHPDLVVALIAYMSPWSTVVRRDTFTQLGGFCAAPRVRYAEDAHLWLRLVFNESIAVSLTPPCALYHTEASDLTAHRSGPRPLEPFLIDPRPIEAACPPELRPLLDQVLARRALKTAAVLGYWGHWREARALVERFAAPGVWRARYYPAAMIACTPLAALLGWGIREGRGLVQRMDGVRRGVWGNSSSFLPERLTDRIRPPNPAQHGRSMAGGDVDAE